jgi:hypothetical protein
MRNSLKFLIIVFLISFTFTGIAYASTSLNIKVLFNSMNIMMNGDKVNIDNFVYNNTTYVPIRKVTELFDKEIEWHDKTNTINIKDKNIKVDGFYTECDNIKPAFIANINNNILELEFLLKNITNEDITTTLHYPYFDFIIYDKNESEIYKHSKEYSVSITLIKDEKIQSGKEFTTNCTVDLTGKNLLLGETYKVVFYTSFEIKSEKKKYKLSESAYFRIPNIPQTD